MMRAACCRFGRQPFLMPRNGNGFKLLWRLLVPALLLAFLAAPRAMAAEFLVNSTTQGRQGSPAVTALADGGFVIVWNSDNGNDKTVVAQRYDSAATPLGPELQVAPPSLFIFDSPSVVGLNNGEFIVAWIEINGAIKARRYTSAGLSMGAEFQLNTTTAGSRSNLDMAALKDGGFVATWTDGSQSGGDTSASAIRARRFDASITPQGDDFLVNTTTLNFQQNPSVAALTDGGFIIAWFDQSAPIGMTGPLATRAQRYDATGARAGTEFLVYSNPEMSTAMPIPGIAGLSDGGFVIAWAGIDPTGVDSAGLSILAQQYASSGEKKGAVFLVNTTTQDGQFDPQVAGLSNGGFVIAWTDSSPPNPPSVSDTDIRAQRFSADGVRQGPELRANATLPSEQILPAMAALKNGGFVIAWSDRSDGNIRANALDLVGETTIYSSVLPAARSGYIGGPAVTVFASAINAGVNSGRNCRFAIPDTAPVTLSYQLADATNTPVGLPDQAFELFSGSTRSFILSFTPVTASNGLDIFPGIVCDQASVSSISGVNTVFLSIDNAAAPDILSISATPDGNGVISISPSGVSFMTVSATNIGVGDAPGSQDAAVTVSVDDGGANLPLILQICETDAAGACITPLGTGDIHTVIGAGPSFFAVFALDQASGGIVLDPANTRVFLRFTDASGTVRSVTSAAVTVQ